MMRPGAPFAPCSVWHELQSPAVTAPDIARVFVPSVTFAVNGGASVTPLE
jgi:hypothetical protein